MARTLGGDHADVDSWRGRDLLEVDRETVGEEQQIAGGNPIGDLRLPNLGLFLVGQEDHHYIPAAGRFGNVEHLETGVFSLGATRRIWAQTDDDVDAGVLQ